MDNNWMRDIVSILYEFDKDEMLASLLAPRVEKLPREDKQYLWEMTYNNRNNRYARLYAKLQQLLMEK